MPRVYWASEQWERAKALRRSGKSYDAIGGAFDISATAVQQKFKREREKQRNGSAITQAGNNATLADRPRITEAALADRDRRQTLGPRDLTAAFCGDPLPGYSALDRR